MPIRPQNKKLYPNNWDEIRERIKKRAGNKCEGCGVKNHAIGYRDEDGKFNSTATWGNYPVQFKIIKIVCTTAHLDHDPRNCDDDNLKFWCQKCHNSYDAPHRWAGIKKRKAEAAGQTDLKLKG